MNAAATRWTLAAMAVASATATAQSVSSVSGLAFGTFIAGSGGTLTVSPGGARFQSGGVVPVGQGASYAPALFNVTGTNNASYTITLPANGSVALDDGAGHTMALGAFASSPPPGQLSGGGSQLVRVGATLTIGNAQPPGSYSGTFNVTVNY